MITQLVEFIPKNDQDLIEKELLSSEMPWFFNNGTILLEDLKNDPEAYKYVIPINLNPFQFVHSVVSSKKLNSNKFDLVRPVLENIVNYYKKDIEVIKAKFNLLTKHTSSEYHYPHVDIQNSADNIKVAVYYVTDSDGDTFIFNEIAPCISAPVLTINKRVKPLKGSAVIFDSNLFHASSSPVQHEYRIVLNVVFRILD